MTHLKISNGNYFAQSAAIAMLAAGTAFTATPATAQAFLDTWSTGMRTCIAAIFGAKERKRVNVHAHHFNCKPVIKPDASTRIIHLSHSQVGIDEQVYVRFKVDTLGVMLPKSAEIAVGQGISIGDIIKLPPYGKQKGRKWIDQYVSRDYAVTANKARQIKPKKVKEWEQAAGQIAAVAIAELGKPRLQRIPASEVNCAVPTFFEDENFRGQKLTVTESRTNLHFVAAGGVRMAKKISSLCIPRGWIVSIHEASQFKGASFTLVGHNAQDDLLRVATGKGQIVNWDNRVSSIRVRRKS